MSENAIDSENSKPAPDTAKPKGARKAGKKGKPAKKVSRAKKAAAKPAAEQQQEGRGHRDDEAREGRDAG